MLKISQEVSGRAGGLSYMCLIASRALHGIGEGLHRGGYTAHQEWKRGLGLGSWMLVHFIEIWMSQFPIVAQWVQKPT